MAKRRKWIKRLEIEPAAILDPMAVWAAEAACHEAIDTINAAAAAGDRTAVRQWRRKLEERCPGLRDAIRRSGHTLEPKHREKLEIMNRALGKLLRPATGTRR